MERIPLETLAKHFNTSMVDAKAAQDNIGFMYRELASPVTSTLRASNRNWIEDAPHENGNYECLCCECDQVFIGHKRRVLCKLCSNLLTPSVSSTQRGSGK